MSRALSDDLRSRVLAASADVSARSAAARFGIGISTAIAWIANPWPLFRDICRCEQQAMKITSFEVGGKAHYGVFDNVIDLSARLGPGYSSISGSDT
jgi:hypothetical protein